nr:GMC oxidoreductase [Polynucleobacter paneuropaeus]
MIVGGGTAGLVIANKLQDAFKVLVVERSEHKKYPFRFRVPLFIGILFRSKQSKYILKKEFILQDGRHIPSFESNVLGGASAINGCVHTIGSKNIWKSILDKFNASYSDLVASYNEIYTTSQTESNKINLMFASQNLIDNAFIKTLKNKGIPEGDMNYSDVENCGPIYNTVKKYFRTSVLSLISKKQFQIFMGESANQILIDEAGKLVGVKTSKRVIGADYVILSAGVIGTCSLLLREKENVSIPKWIADLDIGCGVQDHANLRVNVITKNEIGSLNEIEKSFSKKLSMLIKHCLGKPTLMTGTGATSGVHLDLDGDGEVDTRIQVVQFTETGRHGSDGKYFRGESGFSLSITPINPLSKGSISLGKGGAIVNPSYLSRKEDMDILKLSLSFCLKLLDSEPLRNSIKEIISKNILERDPERYIYDNIFSGHHLIGGAYNAVDSDFEVKGVSGLYICDASVLSEYAASNIHSTVVLISDIFSKKFMSNNLYINNLDK